MSTSCFHKFPRKFIPQSIASCRSCEKSSNYIAENQPIGLRTSSSYCRSCWSNPPPPPPPRKKRSKFALAYTEPHTIDQSHFDKKCIFVFYTDTPRRCARRSVIKTKSSEKIIIPYSYFELIFLRQVCFQASLSLGQFVNSISFKKFLATFLWRCFVKIKEVVESFYCTLMTILMFLERFENKQRT